MGRMAMPGSSLPEGYVLGAMNHADRIGLVYDAHAPEGQGLFSAHVLHPLHVDELREWFEDNALRGKALRHPNLVEVLAVGETHNQLPVMITERVEGRTLRARVAAGDLLVGYELGKVVRAVADALDYLHGQSSPVLHRALMPENVICTNGGAVKLLAVGHAGCPRYAPTKPPYLSPEELCGAALFPASDVFSLASLAFELLTGRPAFAGSPEGIVAAVQREVLPNVGVVQSEALAPINRVLHRAWAALPRDRTPRAGMFAGEFEEALRMVPASLLAVRRGGRDGGARSISTAPRAQRASQPPVAYNRQPSLPAPARPSMFPAALAARRVTPTPNPMPMFRSVSAAFALPPPPRLPTALVAPEPHEGVFELSSPRVRHPTPREVVPVAALAELSPEPREAPRTLVDTDDAVLILEPALVDASELPPPEDDLPPLESVVPQHDDDAPDVEITDDPSSVLQRTMLIDAGGPPRSSVEPTMSALAVVPPAEVAPPTPSMVPSPTALARATQAPSELAFATDPRPSWSRWRPEVIRRPSDRPWHGRELRLTPRLVGGIIAANLLLTAVVVALLVALFRP